MHLFGFYAVAILTSYLGESASRAEEELAEKTGSLANLEVFHRDVIQSISSGLISTDLESRVTTVNRAALEILGASEQALVGKPITESGLFSEAEWVAAASATSADRGARSELVVQRGSERLPIGFTVTRLTDAHDVPAGWIVVFQDLSQWRRLQEELRLKDRMAAVGELAAGLAHEVGNPLAAISGSVQLLSGSICRRSAGTPPARHHRQGEPAPRPHHQGLPAFRPAAGSRRREVRYRRPSRREHGSAAELGGGHGRTRVRPQTRS